MNKIFEETKFCINKKKPKNKDLLKYVSGVKQLYTVINLYHLKLIVRALLEINKQYKIIYNVISECLCEVN